MADAAAVLQSLILQIVRALVDAPDQARVDVLVGTNQVILTVFTHPRDVGKVIGRDGFNAEAIRRLLTPAAGKLKVRAILEISEFDPQSHSPP